MNKRILFLFFLGLAIRLLLSFLPAFKIDANTWFAWSTRLNHFDFSQFYSKGVFTDYTPGYLYILALLGFLKDLLHLQNNIFYLLLKIPAIISDLIIALLVYKEVNKNISTKVALFSLCFVLFNPLLIFNSAIWGQVDSILALLLLSAIIYLKKNKLIGSSILFGLALIVKPQAIALAPLFTIFLIKHFKLSNILSLFIPGMIVIFVLTFPFFPNHTIINLAKHIINTANEYPYTSVNAYNLWGIVGGLWKSDSQVVNGLSFQNWSYIFLFGYWAVVAYFYFRKKLSIFALAALATLAFFFLPTRVHERYLYPAIIFLILLISVYKSKILLILTGILGLLHFLNLYYVYVYYNEIYLKLPKVFYNPILYNFSAENSKNLSLVSTTIFFLITIVIIKLQAFQSEDEST